MKGATREAGRVKTLLLFQSTLPMKGATGHMERIGNAQVSIHAPNEGSDVWGRADGIITRWFQSTLPMKGAT